MNLIGYGHFGRCLQQGFDDKIKILKKGEVPTSDIVFITVRPQDMETVLPLLEDYEGLIITFAAGLPLSYYEEHLPKKEQAESAESTAPAYRIIRAMSNIGVYFGAGVTGYVMNNNCDSKDFLIAENLFSQIGKSFRFYDEKSLDIMTAVSGSGIAYLSEICNIFTKFSESQGMSHKLSEKIIMETLKSVITIHEKSNLSMEEIVKSVASKGGTTEAGLQTMENCGIKPAIQQGLESTMHKCQNILNHGSCDNNCENNKFI